MICQEGLTQKGFFFSPGCTNFRHPDRERPVPVLYHARDIKRGLLREIIKQAGMTVDEVAQFLAVCSRLKWSKHVTKSSVWLYKWPGPAPHTKSSRPARTPLVDESCAGIEESHIPGRFVLLMPRNTRK